MTPAIFTLDLEDRRASAEQPPRHGIVTERLLDQLAERDVRGTFFVVGTLAEAEPALLGRVAAGGHEIALHGWTHTRVGELGPQRFREDTRRGKELLEELTGQPCLGYRAPYFSITPGDEWAADVLSELGFAYSSSVLPAPNPIAGYPGAPRVPFSWPSGLVELPCPVFGPARTSVPLLGGTYLRLAPFDLVKRALARAGGRTPWVYAHPYDFDRDETFYVLPDTGYVTSRLLFLGRGTMTRKVLELCSPRSGASQLSMLDHASSVEGDLETFYHSTR